MISLMALLDSDLPFLTMIPKFSCAELNSRGQYVTIEEYLKGSGDINPEYESKCN